MPYKRKTCITSPTPLAVRDLAKNQVTKKLPVFYIPSLHCYPPLSEPQKTKPGTLGHPHRTLIQQAPCQPLRTLGCQIPEMTPSTATPFIHKHVANVPGPKMFSFIHTLTWYTILCTSSNCILGGSVLRGGEGGRFFFMNLTLWTFVLTNSFSHGWR